MDDVGWREKMQEQYHRIGKGNSILHIQMGVVGFRCRSHTRLKKSKCEDTDAYKWRFVVVEILF